MSISEETEEILNSLSIEQKIGQMICVGLTSEQVDDEFVNTISRYPFGAVGLFSRNVNNKEQVKALTADIQNVIRPACNGLDAMIAIDQEGGVVSQNISGMIQTPGNFAIAATKSVDYSKQCYQIIGQELSQIGITMNWAPVLDLNSNPSNEIIDTRSFGDDAQVVSDFGMAAIEGLHNGGIGATVKHFPGHGNVSLNSDTNFYVNVKSKEDVLGKDLIPFLRAAEKKADAIMVGMIAIPSFEAGRILPAVLSHTMITDVLRDKYHYEGIIMADDLDHESLISQYTLRKTVQMTIAAGTDMIILCHSRLHQINVFNSILNAVKKGKIKQSRIDASVRRIIRMKLEVKEYIENRVSISAMEKSKVIAQICHDSVCILRDPKGLIPVSSEKYKRVLVILPMLVSLSLADSSEVLHCSLGEQLSCVFENVRILNIPLTITAEETKDYIKTASNYDMVIAATENLNDFPGYLHMIKAFSRQKPTIVVSLRHPYETRFLPDDAAVLLAFSHIDASMEAVINVITGRSISKGSLPIEL